MTAPIEAHVSGLTLEAAEARHAPSLVDLFARTNTPCNCQYWHFSGDKNAWLDRIFHAPEQNRAAFSESFAGGDGGLRGLVALSEGRAVGWMKLCPAETMTKLYDQRLYKSLPCLSGDRSGVLTIGCMLVDEDFRRRGVARALVRSGIALAAARRARSIEAFPRRNDQLGAPELWLGPLGIFLEAGFQIVNDFGPYPVLRYDVNGIQ